VAGCSKKKTGAETMIPGDATMVVSVNLQQLMDKLAKNGIAADQMENYLEAGFADSAFKPVKSFLKLTDSLGLDLKQPLYIALSLPKEITASRGIMRVIGSISDAAQFKKFLAKADAEFSSDRGIDFAAVDDMILGFNKNYMVIVKDIPADAMERGKQMGSSMPVKNEEDLSENQIKDLIRKTFANKASASIAANNDYAKLPIGNKDLKIWVDLEYAVNNNTGTGQVTQLVTRFGKEMFTNCSATSLLEFENGRVSATNQMYFNKEAAKIIRNTASQHIDFSMLQHFNGQEINAIMAVSVNPNLILDIIKFIKADGIMNIALAQKNLKPEELFNALSGDAIFIISDLNRDSAKLKSATDANMAVLVKLKNKGTFEKLLSMPEVTKTFKKEGPLFIFQKDSGRGEATFMGQANDIMIISPSRTVVEDYVSGTKNSAFDPAVLQHFKDKSAGYYLNFNSIEKLIPAMAKDKNTAESMNQMTIVKSILGLFKETVMTSTSFNGNYIQSEGYLLLNKTDENFLSVLFKNGGRSVFQILNNAKSAFSPTDQEEPLKPMHVD
jgi:hypothetical protein